MDNAFLERFWTIRKTVFEMLLDRGYLVAESELKMEFLEWSEKLTANNFKCVPFSKIANVRPDVPDDSANSFSLLQRGHYE